jgi:ferredoxin
VKRIAHSGGYDLGHTPRVDAIAMGDGLALGLLFAIPVSGVLAVGARLSGQPLAAEPIAHVVVAPLAILIGPVRATESPEESAAEPLSWALRLQLDACSGCGRCDTACPPAADALPLSPQRILMAQRSDERADCIDDRTLDQCTLCGACEEACPVGISHLPRLRALKRQRDGMIVKMTRESA